MFDRLREDVRTVRETDPAAKSNAEVLLYAGLHAVWAYRLAHWLWTQNFHFVARLVSQLTRFLTGVEIHPGAALGRRVFVDHGMGVVVGETAEIGDDVTMYHGVTLGGDDPRPVKRHPTVGDRVTLGANSTLVGDITIGDDASVGAGAVVVDDVPPGATVVGNPANVVDGGDDTGDGERAESGAAIHGSEGANTEPETAPTDGDTTEDDEGPTTPPEPPACCGAAGAS
jgi:serine O-acetyltransferase